MGSLGTVSIGTKIDTAGIDKGVKDVQAKVESLGKRIVGGVTNAVNAFSKIGLATIGVSALVEAFKGLIGKPLELAANAEVWGKKFEIVMGSGTEAKKMLLDLKNFRYSEGSMLDSDELKRSAASLMAIGVETNKVIPTIRNLGNISSGLSVPLETMVGMYEKVKDTGHITSRELKTAAKEGLPLSQAFADMFQTSKENVRDLAEKGLITFDHFETALNNMNKKGAVFGDMNKEMSGTLMGAWTVLQAKIKERSQKFGEGLSKAFNITGAVQLATRALDVLNDASLKTMEYLGKAGVYLYNVLGKPIVDGFSAAADMVEQFIDFIDSHVKINFGKIGVDVQAFLDMSEYGWKHWKEIFVVNCDIIGLGFISLGNDAVYLFTNTIPEALQWLNQNWRRIWDNMLSYVKYIWEGLKYIVAPASDWIAEKLAGSLEVIGVVPKGTQKAVQQMNQFDAQNRKAPELPALKQLDNSIFTDRQLTDREKALKESIKNQNEILIGGFDKFLEAKKQKEQDLINWDRVTKGMMTEPKEVKLKPKIDLASMPTQQKKISDILAPVATRGSKEARQAELSFRFGLMKNDAQKDIAKNTKEANGHLSKISDKLDNLPVPKMAKI